MARIAPSLLSADFTHLRDEIRRVEMAGCDLLHVDVMDGHFVPNLTFGPFIIEQIRDISSLPLDVHLMISNPEKYVEAYVGAGADYLSVHGEVIGTDPTLLDKIKSLGVRAGLALNPDAEIGHFRSLFDHLDLFLVMSVYAGFGGQKFLPEMLGKVRQAAEWRREFNLRFEIAIDGGINPNTAPLAREAGVDILVAGTAIFGADDLHQAVAGLRGDS